MPKLDPDDQVTTPAASPSAFGTPAATSSFGSATPSTGFGSSSTPAASGFGSTASTGGFGSTSSSGFGSSSSSGFGGSSGGFGGSSGGFGGSSSGFGGGMGTQQGQGQYQQTDTSAFKDAIEASAGHEPEHWMKSFWRPAMGWLYMLTCFCDFVAFPVMWGLLQAFMHMHETGAIQLTQWNPITLQGAGLYHLAMGAILGIAAYGRTQEKKTGTV